MNQKSISISPNPPLRDKVKCVSLTSIGYSTQNLDVNEKSAMISDENTIEYALIHVSVLTKSNEYFWKGSGASILKDCYTKGIKVIVNRAIPFIN